MTLAGAAVRYPIAVLFFTLAVLLSGLFSYTSLEVESFPEIKFPQVKIRTTYPGAAPDELDALVTIPIETRLKGVEDVKDVVSRTREGSSEVNVVFKEKVDLDNAVSEIKSAIQDLSQRLPEEVKDPLVFPVGQSGLPVLILSLTGDRSPNELKQLAEARLKDPFSKVEGVGAIDILGGTRPCVRVSVDQMKLRKYGLSLSEVERALRLANSRLPGGRVEFMGGKYLVRTICAFDSNEDISKVPIDMSRRPPVVVADVAEVQSTYYPSESVSRVNGRENVMIQISKAYDANLLRVAKACLDEMKDLRKTLPADVDMVLQHDLSEFVEEQMSQVKSSALIGGLLAMLVLYLFLRQAVTTAIIALSIPMSVLITLSVMMAADASLNYMSLAGIILSLGMLCDDSIVVLENAVRHNEMGKASDEAATDGANEIASAVLASTITTLIVFAPVFLLGDWGPGTLLKTMCFSLVLAVSASYIVAMTVIPMTCSLFISAREKVYKDEGYGKSWTSGIYRSVLIKFLRHPFLLLFSTFLLFLTSLYLVSQNGFSGNLSIGSNSLPIYFRFAPSMGKLQKESAFSHFEEIAERFPEVESIQAWTNGNRGDGTLMLHLGQSSMTKKETIDSLKERLRPHLSDLPGVRLSFQSMSSLMGKAPIEVSLKGKDRSALEKATSKLTEVLEDLQGLVAVGNTMRSRKRELRIMVDRRRANARGVEEAEIAATVRKALFGSVVTRVIRDNRELDVVVKLEESQGSHYEALGDLLVHSNRGSFVPIRDVSDFRWSMATPEICKRNREREIRVKADVEEDSQLSSLAMKVRSIVSKTELPEGVEVGFGGKAKDEAKGRMQLLMALVFAVFLVYATMAIQFESFFQPMIIMFALPLAMIGCNFALYLSGVTFGLMSAIALILLCGVVVNDAIVLVDYINQVRRTRRRAVLRAVLEAGNVRLRPILMTSLTTIFGVLPMALGLGQGAEVYIPLGIALIGGLAFATVLTLGVIPTVYVLGEKVFLYFAGMRFFARP